MTKSQEYLNEQAEVAQILRDGMVRGLGSPGIADLILQSDWLTERDHRDRMVEILRDRPARACTCRWCDPNTVAPIRTCLVTGRPAPMFPDPFRTPPRDPRLPNPFRDPQRTTRRLPPVIEGLLYVLRCLWLGLGLGHLSIETRPPAEYRGQDMLHRAPAEPDRRPGPVIVGDVED